MPCSSYRLRLLAACALIAAIAGAVFLAPVSAQSGSSWQVAESVHLEVFGYAPVVSPDGRWVAGLKDPDTRLLCVWKVSTAEERCNDESERVSEISIVWSPDSRQVAFSQDGADFDSDVFVFDVLANSLTNLTDDKVDNLKATDTAGEFATFDQWPVWSPDGDELLFMRLLNPRDESGQRHLSLSRVILETGQVVRGQDLVSDDPLFISTPLFWLADDTVVFAIQGAPDIAGLWQADVASGRPQKIETNPEFPISNPPLVIGATADGSKLVLRWLWDPLAIDEEFIEHAWLDMESGEIMPIEIDVPRGEFLVAPAVFSPNGDAMVYGLSESDIGLESRIVVQDLESGDTIDVAEGVNLQAWESLIGIEWTTGNQLALPLEDFSFQIVTLEQQ